MLPALLLASQIITSGACANEPVEPNVYNAACWVDVDQDCPDVGRCDLARAIDRIQHHSYGQGNDTYGPLIQLPAGDWDLDSTVRLGTIQEIAGRGTDRTRVFTSTTAFKLHYRTGAEALGIGRGASTSRIRDLTIRHSNTSTAYSAAIWAEATPRLERIQINGPFTHGVRIDADVTRAGVLQSNANLWRMSEMDIYWTRHAGVFLRGGDSSGGYAERVNVTLTCNDPVPWEDVFPECAAISDRSFLGNTWVMAHAADTRTTDASRYSRHYVFDAGGNQRSMCINCYQEQQTPVSYVEPRAIILGGVGSWEGSGFVMGGGGVVNGLTVRTADNELRLGDDIGNPTAVLAFVRRSMDPFFSQPAAVYWDGPWMSWRMSGYGYAGSNVTARVGASPASPYLGESELQILKAGP